MSEPKSPSRFEETAGKTPEIEHASLGLSGFQKELAEDLAKKTLLDPHCNATAKLHAVEKLYALGEREIKLQDKNGTRNVRLEVEDGSNGSKMVHLFDSNSDQVILRGVDDGKGNIEHEQSNGRDVDFNGRNWSRNEAGNSFLSADPNGRDYPELVIEPMPIEPAKPAPIEPAKPTPAPIEPVKPTPAPIEPAKPAPAPIEPPKPAPAEIEPPAPIKPGSTREEKIGPNISLTRSESNANFSNIRINNVEDPLNLTNIGDAKHPNLYIDAESKRVFNAVVHKDTGRIDLVELNDPANPKSGIKTRLSYLANGSEVRTDNPDKLDSRIRVYGPDHKCQVDAQFDPKLGQLSELKVQKPDGTTAELHPGLIADTYTDKEGNTYFATVKPNGTTNLLMLDGNLKPNRKIVISAEGGTTVEHKDPWGFWTVDLRIQDGRIYKQAEGAHR